MKMVERGIRIDVGPRLTRRGVTRLAAALVVTGMGVQSLGRVAAAQTVEECQAEIQALRDATVAVESFTNPEKDRAGLVGKLDSASDKLAQGKFEGAIQALTQFRDKVADLQAQGKIDLDDADALIAGADDAIACVQSLIVT